MTAEHYNVLFLCTGNSARSIFGEVLINHWGRGRFHGFSAGSHPAGQVNPLTLALLEEVHQPTAGLRSKSWDEFAQLDAPPMDFVFTVCDQAAAEICPVWPGQPMTAHWGVADPAAAEGDRDARMRAFRRAYRELEHRVKLFVSLPIAGLDRLRLRQRLEEIGASPAPQEV
jgi:arsenate reductase